MLQVNFSNHHPNRWDLPISEFFLGIPHNCRKALTVASVHRLIEHGSAATQYRLYGWWLFTGQKTQPTVSKY